MRKKSRKIRIITVLMIAVLFGQWGSMRVLAEEKNDISGKIHVILNVEERIMEKYINGFEQKYPGVTVEYECVTDYENAMQDRIASGDYGDILFIPGFMDSSQITNYFEPLGNYYEMIQKYSCVNSGHMSGNIMYAIPSSAYAMGIAYNKDVFYKAGISSLPTSIDEFMDDMFMIKERTQAVPVYLNSFLDWTLLNWIDFPYVEMTGDADYRGNKFVHEKIRLQRAAPTMRFINCSTNLKQADAQKDMKMKSVGQKPVRI